MLHCFTPKLEKTIKNEHRKIRKSLNRKVYLEGACKVKKPPSLGLSQHLWLSNHQWRVFGHYF